MNSQNNTVKVLKIRKRSWWERFFGSVDTHEITVDYRGTIITFTDFIERFGVFSPEFLELAISRHDPKKAVTAQDYIGATFQASEFPGKRLIQEERN